MGREKALVARLLTNFAVLALTLLACFILIACSSSVKGKTFYSFETTGSGTELSYNLISCEFKTDTTALFSNNSSPLEYKQEGDVITFTGIAGLQENADLTQVDGHEALKFSAHEGLVYYADEQYAESRAAAHVEQLIAEYEAQKKTIIDQITGDWQKEITGSSGMKSHLTITEDSISASFDFSTEKMRSDWSLGEVSQAYRLNAKYSDITDISSSEKDGGLVYYCRLVVAEDCVTTFKEDDFSPKTLMSFSKGDTINITVFCDATGKAEKLAIPGIGRYLETNANPMAGEFYVRG